MHHHHSYLEVLLHALIESIYLLPYLLITYILLEYLEKRTQSVAGFLSKTKNWFSPILAALTGLIPQCGFGVAGANFFAARLISTGTLVALFLGATDEMLPILISNQIPASKIMSILTYKTLIALSAGLFLDMILKKKNHGRTASFQMNSLCKNAQCGCHKQNIWFSALNHTAQIFLFILAVNIVLGTLLLFIDMDHLKKEVLETGFGPLFAAFFGLIPNCATSVITAQLYAEGTLTDSAFLSAILSNSGIALLVLFHVNHPLKQTLKITAYIISISFLSGYLFQMLNLSF